MAESLESLLILLSQIISASRETLIRVLLLCISLGYQMIFPVLGGTCFKATIGIYAGLYWLFYFVVFLLNNVLVNTNDNVSWGGYTFASVIQVIIELVWWFWIFYNTVVVSRILKAVRDLQHTHTHPQADTHAHRSMPLAPMRGLGLFLLRKTALTFLPLTRSSGRTQLLGEVPHLQHAVLVHDRAVPLRHHLLHRLCDR